MATAEFYKFAGILSAALSQHHLLGFELLTKLRIVKGVVFPVVTHGCESWTIKKTEHQRTDAFELWCWRKTLESPLEHKEIKPVNPKGNQSRIFIGRTNAEALILWPPDVKS